jgi:hypothetical protein
MRQNTNVTYFGRDRISAPILALFSRFSLSASAEPFEVEVSAGGGGISGGGGGGGSANMS